MRKMPRFVILLLALCLAVPAIAATTAGARSAWSDLLSSAGVSPDELEGNGQLAPELDLPGIVLPRFLVFDEFFGALERADYTPPAGDTPQEEDCIPPHEPETAALLYVIDGDTISVLLDGEERMVRYIGVDTPETKDPDRPVERFGPEAYEENQRLLTGHETLQLYRDRSEADRYGRLLRFVFAGETFVNLELVSGGFATVLSIPPDVSCKDLFADAEMDARANERGLWAGSTSGSPAP
jgi:micrococcal nuclease